MKALKLVGRVSVDGLIVLGLLIGLLVLVSGYWLPAEKFLEKLLVH